MSSPERKDGGNGPHAGAGESRAAPWAWIGSVALAGLFAWRFVSGPEGSLAWALAGLAGSSLAFALVWALALPIERDSLLRPVAALGNLFLVFLAFVAAARLVPGLDDLGGGVTAAALLGLTAGFVALQAGVMFSRRGRTRLSIWLRDLFASTAAWLVLMIVLLNASR